MEYDLALITPKKAEWEEEAVRIIGRSGVGGEYTSSPSREDCLGIVRKAENEIGELEPIDAMRKVRPFKKGEASVVEEDYLQVETVGVQTLGTDWQEFRRLMLHYFPKTGHLADYADPTQEGFPWVLENYEGKNPGRDFHRRCRKMVKWFQEWVSAAVN